MTPDETSPTEFKKIRGADQSHIKGWGTDADPENDPAYPMKKRIDAEQRGYTWDKPPQQPVNVEILHSVERPDITAVFGTSMPPKGLSGMIRRFAFKYSESSYSHWLPLILADRIAVFEGIWDDLKHGHITNIFGERGWQAEWKYNRKAFVQKAAVVTVVTSAVIAVLLPRKKKKKFKLF